MLKNISNPNPKPMPNPNPNHQLEVLDAALKTVVRSAGLLALLTLILSLTLTLTLTLTLIKSSYAMLLVTLIVTCCIPHFNLTLRWGGGRRMG